VATKVGAASVVGGDGRAAIVVDDAPPAGGNPPVSESSIRFAGHPEPGRDVFAAKPIDPVKSQAVQNEEAMQPPEEKVVSTVAVTAARVANVDELAQLKKLPDNAETPIPPNDEPITSGSSDQSDENISVSDVSNTSSGGELEPQKEHGPVVEEVAEADRVRAELFDENPDQDVEAA
jgi:hypothetical protein